MKESKAYLIALVTAIFLSVVLCASPCFASDISSTSQAEPTITVPLTQWNELKSNNEKALNSIEASNVPLTEAQTLVVKQGQELTEAHNTINRLESELAKAKADSVKQEATLNEMQKSLDVLKNKIERDNRTIKRLRMQRNLSQVVGAGAIIGVVIHR
jgi:septal ring factor EnvC (AmiA/AmiB activator)